MRKIYFLGGEDIKARDSEAINLRAFGDAGGNPVVLIFPWTGPIVDGSDKYRPIMSDYFHDMGAKDVVFAELSESLPLISKKIDDCDLIYLPGGDPELLISRLREKDISEVLQRSDKIFVGNSAGAFALCKNYVVIKGQENSGRTELLDGIGRVNFAVSVHYKSRDIEFSGHEPELELTELSKRTNMKIFAIPENSAVIYNFDTLAFMGEVHLFQDGDTSLL